MERYQKIEKNGAVGEGTYGVVYKGIDLWNNSFVALKRIRLETDDEGIPCTTLREIAVLRQLKHPNIVELTDVVQQSWRLYLVFEFVDMDLKKVKAHWWKHGFFDPFIVILLLLFWK
jgi:serine/threonine protein kinase